MKMVKNGIRKILIAFIIVVVSFQSSFVGKAAEEPTIIDSGYSILGNTLKLNDAGYMSDIIGVSVNDKEYTKVDKKSDLIASEKYALLEDCLLYTSPSVELLRKYADYFDVSMDYIFARCDDPHGKLYEAKPPVDANNPELRKFVEMCFDPES